MYFDTYGPIDVHIDDEPLSRWRGLFWKLTNERYPNALGIENAIGCYAFGVRKRKNVDLHYVGKTTSKAGFKGEIFQNHKKVHYQEALIENPGQGVVFLFPLLADNSAFSNARAVGAPVISWLEKTLISMAVANNPNMRNSKDTRFSRNVQVYGLLGKNRPGRRYPEYHEVRNAFLNEVKTGPGSKNL